MLMPSIFDDNWLEDWMDFPFERGSWGARERDDRNAFYGRHGNGLMKTDVREKDGNYEVDMDLPGFKKEDLSLKLENGCLTVTAKQNVDNDQKDDQGRYIRRERYSGTMSRSFYVGENITESDIHAKYEDGILKLTLPKPDSEAVESRKYIAIEG